MTEKDKFPLQAITLSALLHDIGKFWQRADKGKESLSQQSLKMEPVICKVFDGRYSYKHVLWTNEFFERYNNLFPINVTTSVSESPLDNCSNFASYHHAPSTVLHELIQQADWLSSGVERRKTEDAQDEYAGTEKFKRVRLDSIFEKIRFDQQALEVRNWKYPLKPLSEIRDQIFPRPRGELIPADGELLTTEYSTLWNGFVEEFQTLSSRTNFDVYLNDLLSLLEKYTWCIPSSTIDIPDISLYDHLRSTAAIAASLYLYHSQTNSFTSVAVRDKTIKKFVLVAGDLSGIQKYLFNLVHTNIKGVSKILRARSFYLSMLPTVAAHSICHRLGLPILCILMDSGGRFVLIAPNTDQTFETLESCRADLDAWFKQQFLGELTLNLSYETILCGEDFSSEKFANSMNLLSENIDKKKLMKLHSALLDNEVWNPMSFRIDEHYEAYSESSACRCCGKLPAIHKYPFEVQEFSDEQLSKLCGLCYEQLRTGKWLTEYPIIAFSQTDSQNPTSLKLFDNYCIQFLSAPLSTYDSAYLVEEIRHALGITPVRNRYIRQRYLANYVPQFDAAEEYDQLCPICKSKDDCALKDEREIDQIKTFECLATASRWKSNENEVVGKPVLGILKADVDRLGLLFSIGLEKTLSIARYATMSRMLNLFFSGYLNELLRTTYQNVYTVYSGGDDLFLLGEWKSIINLAHRLYSDFRHYTCQNPSITLSAGVVLARSKFPINRAASMAEEALECSKDSGRDKLTLFDTTIDWKKFSELQAYAEFLDKQLNDDDSKIKSAFLYRLLRYHRMYREANSGNIEQLRFHSLMAYDVRRNILRKEGEAIVNQEELEQLYRLFELDRMEYSLMQNLQIPLFYVLYKNRR